MTLIVDWSTAQTWTDCKLPAQPTLWQVGRQSLESCSEYLRRQTCQLLDAKHSQPYFSQSRNRFLMILTSAVCAWGPHHGCQTHTDCKDWNAHDLILQIANGKSSDSVLTDLESASASEASDKSSVPWGTGHRRCSVEPRCFQLLFSSETANLSKTYSSASVYSSFVLGKGFEQMCFTYRRTNVFSISLHLQKLSKT